MKQIIVAVLIAMSLPAAAAETTPASKKEIEHLIGYLAASGCEFNRNGRWHSAARAVSHLRRKYEYLEKRDLVPTAEAFIKNAASESSSSGKPYVVRCSGKPDVQSSEWFVEELSRLRAQSSKAAKD